MCLILFAYQQHPNYPLIVAANRDEFYRRATRTAHFWPETDGEKASGLLAGRDLEAGGTWLGLSRSGRFAAVTNFRDGSNPSPAPRSRGQLTTNFLNADLINQPTRAFDYLTELDREAHLYGGFNLLLGEIAPDQSLQLYCYSNQEREIQHLKPGIYGLSNHLLNTPWPKTVIGKTALSEAIAHLPDTQELMALLQNPHRADDRHLPDTGISLEWERLLSSAFISSEGYGTRASTIVTLCSSNQEQGSYSAFFAEQTYAAPSSVGSCSPQTAISFQFPVHPTPLD